MPTMKLFHWTAEKNLLGIAMGGLEPFCYDDAAGLVSAGRKVVWLTANETRTPTAADVEFIKARPDLFDERFLTLAFGQPDDVRLTVRFNSSNNRQLKRAWPWLRQFSFHDPMTGEVHQLGQDTGLWPTKLPQIISCI